MKRIFAVVLVLCLMAALVPVHAHASEVVARGDWNGGNTQWELTSNGTLTLTGTRHMQGSNDPNNYPWRAYADDVTKIVVAGEITTICNHAFLGMTNVTSVVIGDTVEKIENEAFRGCTSLVTITIPASVTEIGTAAFMECTSLPTVTFAEDSKLAVLGDSVFMYSGLTSQTIPCGVKELSANTFYECRNLTSVTLQEGLEYIDQYAFYYCEKLTTILFPSTLTRINMDAFQQCLGLEHLELYNPVEVAQYFPQSSNLSSIIVLGSPESVSGFQNCTSLSNVILPDSIKRIEDSTFRSCTSLTSLDWPDAVAYIGDSAFAHSGFVNITLPDTVTEIGANAFRSDNLVSFICGSGLQAISGQAFEGSSSLTTVDLGNVKAIGDYAFNECSSLNTIIWSDELMTIGQRAFANCDALTRVDIPASVTSIGSQAFENIDYLEIRFQGDAPRFGDFCFMFTIGIAYYPSGNDTWTEEVMQNYGGDITWVPDDHVHDFAEMTFAPTCTEKGYTAQECTSCGGKIDLHSYVDALGHDVLEATCTDPKTCQREGCDYTEGSALGHNWDDPTASPRTCTICGFVDEHTHDYVHELRAPTCEYQGYTTHICSTCGHSYTDSYTDPLGHDLADVACGEQYYCQREDCSYYGEIKGHSWENEIAIIKVCTICGTTEGGYRVNLPDNSTTVWIDGVEYAVTQDGNSYYIDLDYSEATNLVIYTYNDPNAADIHTQYPTSMQVFILDFQDGVYASKSVGAFDNLLQYSGSSIRITGNKGIRMITSITKGNKSALTGDGLAGYKLVEYGTALCWASDLEGGNPMTLGQSYVKSNYAYKRGVADPVFAYSGDLVQYTNVLVGFTLDQCKDDIAMRPYITLEDANGEQITIYGGIVYRSIGYIAYQNRNVFNAGTGSYNYVWEIIHHVYGDKYDADYKG